MEDEPGPIGIWVNVASTSVFAPLAVHVAAATENFRQLAWFHDHIRIERMIFDCVLDPSGGALVPKG